MYEKYGVDQVFCRLFDIFHVLYCLLVSHQAV